MHLGVRAVLEPGGGFALAFDNQLAVLNRDADILLAYAGKDRAQVQVIFRPAMFELRAETPGSFPATAGWCGSGLMTVEIIEHLINRSPELVQRLLNIVYKH